MALNRNVFISIALVASLVTAASAQDGPEVLLPIDNWQVRIDDDRCSYTRTFGDAEAPTFLELRRLDPWDGGFHVAMSNSQFNLSGPDLTAAWMPGGTVASEDTAQRIADSSGREWIVFAHGLWNATELDHSEFKTQLEYFQVANGFEREVAFITGPMLEVWEGLDECMSEVMRRNGIDPADADRSDSRVEFRNRERVARNISSELPSIFEESNRYRWISFLTFVDDEARPISCRLASLPYDPDFERYGCTEILENGRFRFHRGESQEPTFVKLTIAVNG